ncbi:MAG TPA: hypothetical protein VIF83_09330 [Gemmatimonadaceae bacterium]
MSPLSENELDDLVARERERGIKPLTEWSAIAAQLRAEGLIRKSDRPSLVSTTTWMRIAASLLLVAGGIAIGRYTARSSPQSNAVASAPTTNASNANFASAEEAWSVLNRAGEEYQRASAYLSANNTNVPMPSSPSMYRTRLAALDNVMSDMRAALQEAPQDPVINQYYLATVGAREATLRQLGTTLPPGAKLNRF